MNDALILGGGRSLHFTIGPVLGSNIAVFQPPSRLPARKAAAAAGDKSGVSALDNQAEMRTSNARHHPHWQCAQSTCC